MEVLGRLLPAMAKEGQESPRRPGRKPKPPGERLRNRIMLNLNDEELRRLVEAAGDQAPSDYARRVLLRHLARRPR